MSGPPAASGPRLFLVPQGLSQARRHEVHEGPAAGGWEKLDALSAVLQGGCKALAHLY